MRITTRSARFPTCIVVAALLSTALCGCQTSGMSDITGSLGAKSETATDTDPRHAAEILGELYRAKPDDADIALQYGQALRTTGQHSQAVAVLEHAAIAHSTDKAILAGYGRALVDNGDFQQAFDVLSRAHTPDNPDWHILSVQGIALDQLGRNEEARQYYVNALKIAPDEPSVLSNLGLSYALTKDLPKAEEYLRRAYARPGASARVRQNLALVVGLEGRFGEAEHLMKGDAPVAETAGNVAYLKQLLAGKDKPAVESKKLAESEAKHAEAKHAEAKNLD
jgi:Flp pilus assembly protein TadD